MATRIWTGTGSAALVAFARRRVQLSRRDFTSSAPVLKKRRPGSSGSLDADDLFGSAAVDKGDLFSSSIDRSGAPPKLNKQGLGSALQKPSPRKSTGSKTSSQVKSQYELFDEHYAFLMDRLGPKPVAVHPQVRDRAIKRLLHHSRGPEHLDRIMEALVKWRNDGRTIDDETAVELIDRILAWQPPLILTLLGNKPKYGVTLPKLPTKNKNKAKNNNKDPNIPEARRILRRLVLYRPPSIAGSQDAETKKRANAEALKNAVTFAALLPAHGFPKAVATQDEVLCALLAQACARNLVFAEALEGKKLEVGEVNGGAEGAEGASVSVSVPPTRRATPLGTASTRGLLAISSSLATLLRVSHPSQTLLTLLGSSTSNSYSSHHEPENKTKRMSGLTQTPSDERSWVGAALRDVVRALQGVLRTSSSSSLNGNVNPGGLGSAKASLDVLEKAFAELSAVNANAGAGTGKASLA